MNCTKYNNELLAHTHKHARTQLKLILFFSEPKAPVDYIVTFPLTSAIIDMKRMAGGEETEVATRHKTFI